MLYLCNLQNLRESFSFAHTNVNTTNFKGFVFIRIFKNRVLRGVPGLKT